MLLPKILLTLFLLLTTAEAACIQFTGRFEYRGSRIMGSVWHDGDEVCTINAPRKFATPNWLNCKEPHQGANVDGLLRRLSYQGRGEELDKVVIQRRELVQDMLGRSVSMYLNYYCLKPVSLTVWKE